MARQNHYNKIIVHYITVAVYFLTNHKKNIFLKNKFLNYFCTIELFWIQISIELLIFCEERIGLKYKELK